VKDAPEPRAIEPPERGAIFAVPQVGTIDTCDEPREPSSDNDNRPMS
jgi:hypothetical protein